MGDIVHDTVRQVWQFVDLVQPKRYSVVIMNDDYTPMAFVVTVLIQFFGYSVMRATSVMYTIHHEGRAVCGVYSKDVAETKAQLINVFARQHEHPLLCIVEPVL